MPPPEASIRRAYRIRIIIFLLCVFLAIVVLPVASRFVATLRKLDDVETERDRWQRPDEIVGALALRHGSRVADLGCGSGYFALKLAQQVGSSGEVLAEDIRRLPLIFLQVRAVLRGHRNLNVILGTPHDPKLPAPVVDAVLIANTYHELDRPDLILACLFQTLRPGGRLVVVDRGPPSRSFEPEHHLTGNVAETQIREAGYHVLHRDDRFIARADDDTWWIIVASRP